MKKTDIIGVIEVGVLKHVSGEYLCWNNDTRRLYLGKIEDAHIILGDKKLNSNGLIDMYKQSFPNRDANMELEFRTYVYMRDLDNSFIVTDEMLTDVAWLYDYIQK